MPIGVPLNHGLLTWRNSVLACMGPARVGLGRIPRLFLLALSLTMVGVNADMPRQLIFKHIEADAVESLGHINDIVQDHRGFMWFAGANGLARYDGYELKIFRNNELDPHSLPDNFVNDLMLSSAGEMWIGSRGGLHRYDETNDKFVNFAYSGNTRENVVVNDVNEIIQDAKGRFWLATRGGLFEFDRTEEIFKAISYDIYPAQDGVTNAWSLAEDAAGYLWVGHQTGGLTRFHPDKKSFAHYRYNSQNPASLSNNDVRKVYIDERNRVWLGTYGGGLNRYERDRDQFVRYEHDASEKGGIVWDILQGEDGLVWIGDGQSLTLLDEADGQLKSFRYIEGVSDSLGNHVVTTLYRDAAGDTWLGFFPSGIDLVDKQASVFDNYRHDPYNKNSITDGGVISSFEDISGNLWIGTGFGLSYLNRKTDQISRIQHEPGNRRTPSGSTILSVIEDHKQTLWLGVWSGGLNRRDNDTGEYTYYMPEPNNPNSLLGKEPWDVIEDSRRDIWVASEVGVSRYNRATDDFTRFMPPLEMLDGDNVLYSRVLFEDSRNNFWVGTVRGLFLLNRDTGGFTRYHHVEGDDKSLSADFVIAIYEDRNGNLWLGTEGGGVNVMVDGTGTFVSYGVEHGLADHTVTGIQGDRDGYIWLSTQKGLSRFDPVSKTFRNFDKRHGLSGNLFNRNTPLLTAKGELLFGNSKGFSLFDPRQLGSNTYVPPVVLTNFQIFNKPVSPHTPGSPLKNNIHIENHITLDYDQSVFSFTFSALSFRSPEDNRYAYRLLGFDSNWNDIGTRRMATYTNLDPGEYIFEVKGSNNDDVWSNSGPRVRVTVLPPLWRTWWAYTLYCLAFVLLVSWFIHTQRVKVAFARKRVEQERAVVRKLQEVDRLKDEFLANTSHELRTPLNGIIGLAESLMEGVAGDMSSAAKKDLIMISASGKRLASLVDDILDFSKLKNQGLKLRRRKVDLRVLTDVVLALTRPLLPRRSIKLSNNVPEALANVWADEDRLVQILHNLIGNAAKFTEAGEIAVGASVDGNDLIISVSDTGIGIEAHQFATIFESFQQIEGTAERMHSGTGLGLSVTKKLVELHGGRIWVQSKIHEGSTFCFTLPRYQQQNHGEEIDTPMPAVLGEMSPSLAWSFEDAMDDVEEVASPSGSQNRVGEPWTMSANVEDHSGRHFSGAHILIVDDEPVNLRVLRNILALQDFRVTQVGEGVQAVAQVEQGDIDLVILDVMMPRLSGYDTCKQIRAKYTAYELPIILLTARSQAQDLMTGFAAGANDYLTKPVAKEELLARVNTHLQLLEVHRHLDQKVAERTHELNEETKRLQQTQFDLERAYQRLEEHSVTDPLTQLKNRRFLNQCIGREAAYITEQYRSWKNGILPKPPRNQDLVFLLVDVDHFKSVNDTHGHGAGDRLLEQFADVLRETVRESDYIIRWGGEEFLIVARGTVWEEVSELAQRLLQNVEAKEFQLGPEIHVHKTCSIGFAPCPFSSDQPDLLNWEQIIDRADRALYAAKNSGRNCWVGLRGRTATTPFAAQERTTTTVVVDGEEYQCSSSHSLEPLVWSARD